MDTLLPEQAIAPVAEPESSVTPPRSWSFVDRRTGETVQYTCMEGCTLSHASDIESPTYPGDIWCWFWGKDLTLPVNENGAPEEFRVLSTVIKVEPWAPQVAHRLPFAVIELVDDHFIDGLDPDGLETVIKTLAGRLDQMCETHRRLVEVRAAYRARVNA